MFQIGFAYCLSRRFDDAVPKLLLAIHEDPSHAPSHRCLAVCYAHMGRLDEARQVIARLRSVTSVTMPDLSYLQNVQDRQLYESGLRLAMGAAE